MPIRLIAERAIKTIAQALVAIVAAEQFDILSADWQAVLATAATAGAISVLTSIGSLPFGPSGTPSLVSRTAAEPMPEGFGQ